MSDNEVKLPKVDMRADAMIPGRLYVWDIPEIKSMPTIVKLNEKKDGLKINDEEWLFEDDIVGSLHGPLLF